MAAKTIIVNDLGMLYRFSAAAWKAYAKHRAEGGTDLPTKHGAKAIGHVAHEIHNFDEEQWLDAAGLLDREA